MSDERTAPSLSSLMKNADMLPLTERAILFATVKHAGTVRKGMTVPYITHVMEAMEIVSRITDDDKIRAAAVLHDTLEDTDTTVGELNQYFGPWVTELVLSATEDKRTDQDPVDTWKIRKIETLEHLSQNGTAAKIIAIGDKLSNIRDMVLDHRQAGDKLWERFNQKDPEEQKWYYTSLADLFGADYDIGQTEAYREYRRLVDELFG